MTAPVLPAELREPIYPGRPERLVIVTDDDRELPVRWRMDRISRWRCPEHGALREATCEHTFAAALVLAESLLGIRTAPVVDNTRRTQE